MSEEKERTLIKAGSLWKHTSQNGKEYFAGNCSFRILIFKNRSKKGEKSPDYYMFVADRQQPERPADENAPPAPDEEGSAF